MQFSTLTPTQVLHYHFGLSSFDVWISCLFRSLTFSIVALSFSCCDKVKLLRLLKSIAPACLLILTIFFCFVVAKLLTSFEFYPDSTPYRGPHLNKTLPLYNIDLPCLNNSSTPCGLSPNSESDPYHPWLWSILGWATLGSILYVVLLLVIVSIKPDPSLTRRIRHLRVLDTDPEASEDSPLLNHDGGTGKNPNDDKDKRSFLSIMYQCFKYARSDFHLFLVGFFFLALSSTTMAFIPYYTGMIINHIAISPSTEEFQHVILVMSSITVVSAVSAGLRGLFLLSANAKLNIRIRKELFKALMKQEIGFFDTSDTGDLTSRLTSDTTKLADQIGLNLNIFLRYISSVYIIQYVQSKKRYCVSPHFC